MGGVAGGWGSGRRLKHINLKELVAVRLAVERIPAAAGLRLSVFIDNTTALGQIRRGSSRSFGANRQVALLEEAMQERAVSFGALQYVRSGDNLADFWSRLVSSGPDLAWNATMPTCSR